MFWSRACQRWSAIRPHEWTVMENTIRGRFSSSPRKSHPMRCPRQPERFSLSSVFCDSTECSSVSFSLPLALKPIGGRKHPPLMIDFVTFPDFAGRRHDFCALRPYTTPVC